MLAPHFVAFSAEVTRCGQSSSFVKLGSAMQTTRRLFAVARLGLAASQSTTITAPPVCHRCGRCVSAPPILSAPVRLFARKTQPADETKPTPRKGKRTAVSSASSTKSTSDGEQPGDGGNGHSASAELMRLLAQLPAADVPVAMAALKQRLTTSRKPQAELVLAEAEIEDEAADEGEEHGEDEMEEDEDEDENEAEYAVLRARLAKEGSVTTEAGEEIISMEEVERQLAEDGELDDAGEAVAVNAEEEDVNEELVDEEEEEAEQILEEEEADQQPAGRPQRSASTTGSSTSGGNTFWIQERRDGTVTVTEWPFGDEDDDSSSDLSASYDLNMPNPSHQQAGVVGQNIGGEKLRRADVLTMREKDLTEHFTKGGGRGGQKVNKTSNCVHLHHTPTGTIVKCHATRSLAENRRIAREIMQGRLEELMLGPASKNAQRAAKIRKQKAKTRRRAAIKYEKIDEVEEDYDRSNTAENGDASGRSNDTK